MKRLPTLQKRLSEVNGDIDWCREEGKATAVSGLHRLALELEREIDDLEEMERERLESLAGDEAELVAGLLADFDRLPPKLRKHIVSRLRVAAREPKAPATTE